MPRPITKVICLVLCFSFLLQQAGFSQVAGELDIAAHLALLRNSLTQDSFHPLHLRYLGYDRALNNFNLLIDKGDVFKPKDHNSQPTSKNPKPNISASLEEETKILLSYFFIGLSLPNDSFWVNLRPDAQDAIIDPLVGQTDIGKVLLEADLNLKKDTARFTSPQTFEGKEYWNKLYQKAEELFGRDVVTIPTLTRPWIVPGEIIIRETADNAYIYKATLKVMLEEDYLKTQNGEPVNRFTGAPVYSFSDERSQAINEYACQLLRQLIVPKLTKEVNTAKRYAPLRQVYYSLILAQWFKKKFSGQNNSYANLIDQKDLAGLASRTAWSKSAYFNAYQKSFKEGEYNIQEQVYGFSGQLIRRYLSGGVVFGRLASLAMAIPGSPKRTRGLFGLDNLAACRADGPIGDIRVSSALVEDEPESTGQDIPGPTAAAPAQSTASPASSASAVAPAQASSSINLASSAIKVTSLEIISWLRKSINRLRTLIGQQLAGPGPSLREHLQNSREVLIAELVALQTHLNQVIRLDSRFSNARLKGLQKAVGYWSHNIANFISRQFADTERGIVELVSNALDASGSGRVSILLRNGQLLVANGGKGVDLADIFTCFLIPTYSTKSVIDEKIGRFGVGFLSALNYLEAPGDLLEIVSFSQGRWFRIRFGVNFEAGVNRGIAIKSIAEDLGQDAVKESFPNIDASALKNGGTSIRVVSGRLSRGYIIGESEIDKIEKALQQRFGYWTGNPVRVEMMAEDKTAGGERASYEIGLDKGSYAKVFGPQEEGAKHFQVLIRQEKPDSGILARASNPGSGKLIITLQGVVLKELSVPGSNVFEEIIVNLPASTKIPTSRDRVIIDEHTIRSIFSAAQGVCNEDSLSVKDRIAVLNSLYYLLGWARVTNPSLVAKETAAFKFDDLVQDFISNWESSYGLNQPSLIFVPDTLQAKEFFAGMEEAVLVNPKLLSRIRFLGVPLRKLEEASITVDGLKGLKILLVPVKTDTPLVKLGDYVFVNERHAANTQEIIWQNVLVATAVYYWQYMATLLGDLGDASFESPGKYGGVDENAARKELVAVYLKSRITKFKEDKARVERAINILPQSEAKDDGLKNRQEEQRRLEKTLASFERLLALVENSEKGGIFYFIFKSEIEAYGSILLSEAEGIGPPVFNAIRRKSGVGLEDIERASEMLKSHPSIFGQILKHHHGKGGIETPLAEKGAGQDQDIGSLKIRFVSWLVDNTQPMALQLPKELGTQDTNLFFAVEVISRWIERGEGDVISFIEDIVGKPQGEEVTLRLLRCIFGYRMNPKFHDLSQIGEEEIDRLLKYLTIVFLQKKQQANDTDGGLGKIKNSSRGKPILQGKLASILASFLKKGEDIARQDIAQEKDEQGLRFSASQGQIQQSINYQDPEEFIFIREFLQNCRDAILEKDQARGLSSSQERRIEMETRLAQDGREIKLEFVVRDFIGMDLARVLNFLLVPNRSSKTIHDFLTGFFGHGFFTSLRESEEVWVRTSQEGKVIEIRLTPVLDLKDGVVTDVGYELYEYRQAGQNGTEIIWRKRGAADPIDVVLLQAKAEMLSRTINGDILEITLNGERIQRINWPESYLAAFSTESGRNCGVYLDENQPSIAVQDGLFVTRLNRDFLVDVLGISPGADLFKFLMRLIDLGVVISLPGQIALTRDRGHLVKDDFDNDTRNIIFAALFDAAIKVLLAGKISLPYSFDYDFLTDIRPDPNLENPSKPQAGFFGLQMEKSDYLQDPLNKLLEYLIHPNANLLNIAKYWGIVGNAKLQDLLSQAKETREESNGLLRRFLKDLIVSAEFYDLIQLFNKSGFTPEKALILREHFKTLFWRLFENQYEWLNRETIDSKIDEFFSQASIFKYMDSVQQGQDQLQPVKRFLNGLLDMLYAEIISSSFSGQINENSFSGKELKSPYSGLIMKGLQDDQVSQRGIKEIFGLRLSREVQPDAVKNLPPAIRNEIITYLSSRFIRSQPLSFGQIWAEVDDEINNSPEEITPLSLKKISARIEKPLLLKNGIKLQEVEERFKDQLPHLYYFLKATDYLIKIFNLSLRRYSGAGLPESVDVYAYADDSDSNAKARGGEMTDLRDGRKIRLIKWNLNYSIGLMQNLILYLANPSDEGLERFLPEMLHDVGHELVHIEEAANGNGSIKNTHNKRFFDRQAQILGALLRNPLREKIKAIFINFAEEFQSVLGSHPEITNDFLASRDKNEAIRKINAVLEEAAASPLLVSKTIVTSPDTAGQQSAASPPPAGSSALLATRGAGGDADNPELTARAGFASGEFDSVIFADVNLLNVMNKMFSKDAVNLMFDLLVEVIAKAAVKNGVFFRRGGDEFVIVTTQESAPAIVETIKQRLDDLRFAVEYVKGEIDDATAQIIKSQGGRIGKIGNKKVLIIPGTGETSLRSQLERFSAEISILLAQQGKPVLTLAESSLGRDPLNNEVALSLSIGIGNAEEALSQNADGIGAYEKTHNLAAFRKDLAKRAHKMSGMTSIHSQEPFRRMHNQKDNHIFISSEAVSKIDSFKKLQVQARNSESDPRTRSQGARYPGEVDITYYASEQAARQAVKEIQRNNPELFRTKNAIACFIPADNYSDGPGGLIEAYLEEAQNDPVLAADNRLKNADFKVLNDTHGYTAGDEGIALLRMSIIEQAYYFEGYNVVLARGPPAGAYMFLIPNTPGHSLADDVEVEGVFRKFIESIQQEFNRNSIVKAGRVSLIWDYFFSEQDDVGLVLGRIDKTRKVYENSTLYSLNSNYVIKYSQDITRQLPGIEERSAEEAVRVYTQIIKAQMSAAASPVEQTPSAITAATLFVASPAEDAALKRAPDIPAVSDMLRGDVLKTKLFNWLAGLTANQQGIINDGILAVPDARQRQELFLLYQLALQLLQNSGPQQAAIDYAHTQRVIAKALAIGELFAQYHVQFDPDVVEVAAYLHDVAKAPGMSSLLNHHRLAAPYIAAILAQLHYSQDFIDRVIACVQQHMGPLGTPESPAFMAVVNGKSFAEIESDMPRPQTPEAVILKIGDMMDLATGGFVKVVSNRQTQDLAGTFTVDADGLRIKETIGDSVRSALTSAKQAGDELAMLTDSLRGMGLSDVQYQAIAKTLGRVREDIGGRIRHLEEANWQMYSAQSDSLSAFEADYGGYPDQASKEITGIVREGILAASPVVNNANQVDELGGIDLRSLPIVSHPQLPNAGRRLLVPGGAMAEDLKKEWQDIQRMLESGITPSGERIREYMMACCRKQDCAADINSVLVCIADILRMEEERVVLTESGLRGILMVLESDASPQNMLIALSQIPIDTPEPVARIQ